MRQKMVTVKQPAETVVRDWHGPFPLDVCTPVYFEADPGMQAMIIDDALSVFTVTILPSTKACTRGRR
jgi:hypothetical protein